MAEDASLGMAEEANDVKTMDDMCFARVGRTHMAEEYIIGDRRRKSQSKERLLDF